MGETLTGPLSGYRGSNGQEKTVRESNPSQNRERAFYRRNRDDCTVSRIRTRTFALPNYYRRALRRILADEHFLASRQRPEPNIPPPGPHTT